MTAIMRRKRLADGTFGDMEKVFSGETADEKVKRVANESESLQQQNLTALMGLADLFEAKEASDVNIFTTLLAITELYEAIESLKGDDK